MSDKTGSHLALEDRILWALEPDEAGPLHMAKLRAWSSQQAKAIRGEHKHTGTLIYRKIIACKHAHGFIGEIPDQPMSLEVLMASGASEADAADNLTNLAAQYGWTMDAIGIWDCGRHRFTDTEGQSYTLAHAYEVKE